jgi:hypothetical protein
VIAVVAAVAVAVAGWAVIDDENGAAPERFEAIVAGQDAPALSGDDVLALERFIGPTALDDVRAVGASIDEAAAQGCTVEVNDALMHARVARHLLAIAIVEAAHGRGGVAMALSTSADLALALNRCLPFDVASAMAADVARATAATALYLRRHGALDDDEAKALAASLSSLTKEQAAALVRPAAAAGALVLVPASVQCRQKNGKTVLTASEAREVARRYQQRPPQLTPAFGPRGIEGLHVVVDAFLASCGFVAGDVVASVNGVRAAQADRLLGVADAIAAARRATVVVVRGGRPVTLTIEEDRGDEAPGHATKQPPQK